MIGSAPAPKITLIGYPYCRAQDLLIRRSVTTPIPLINNDYNGATVTVKCPKGLAVVSGGFRAPSVFTGSLATSTVPVVIENRRLGKSGPWRASTLYGGTATDTTTLTASGYCG